MKKESTLRRMSLLDLLKEYAKINRIIGEATSMCVVPLFEDETPLYSEEEHIKYKRQEKLVREIILEKFT